MEYDIKLNKNVKDSEINLGVLLNIYVERKNVRRSSAHNIH